MANQYINYDKLKFKNMVSKFLNT
nr:hypothetical protein [Bacillus cereus]